MTEEVDPDPLNADIDLSSRHYRERVLTAEDRPSLNHRVLEVVFLWRDAVMGVGHYSDPRAITIGDATKNDFRLSTDELPVERFPLVDEDEGDFVAQWTDAMNVEVRSGDTVRTLQDLKKDGRIREDDLDGRASYSYTLGLEDLVVIGWDEIAFVIRFVAPARWIPISFWRGLDAVFARWWGVSLGLHVLLIALLMVTPAKPADLEDELFLNPNRFAQLILKEPEKPKPNKVPRAQLSGSKGGGRHKGKEGKFGKDKGKKDALASKKGAPQVDPDKSERDRKIALESGIFAALKGGPGGAVSNVFGPGGLGTGINDAMGGLRGTAMGEAGGVGGLGTRGTGPGGGGTSLGIGGLGKGKGRGTGGLGKVDLGGRGRGKYKVSVGRTVTRGCITQEVVLRVINRVHAQAKYCYERELAKTPDLEGKITTSFEIGSTGAVKDARVSRSTMGSPPVEACLLRVVQRLRFPPCKGGGTATVTYPWIFKTSG